MYDVNLRNKINNLLKKIAPRRLKMKDIGIYCKIRKHKRKDLIHTLNKMVKNGEIARNGRYYYLTSSGENNKIRIISGKFDGRPLARDKSYAFVIGDDEDYFIPGEDTKNAYDGDIVEIEVKYSSRGKKYAQVINIIERKHKTIIGNIEKYGNKLLLIPDNSRIHTDFNIGEINEAKPGDKVILKIRNWGSEFLHKIPIGDVIEILGKAGDPKVEILSIIKFYDLPLEFPECVKLEAQNILKEVYKITSHKRMIYKELQTITIDPMSAKDYDDAISIEVTDKGYKLYVHIADVAEYVGRETEIFKEALTRGNSFYFPKRVIPMLPEELSNGLCSLRPQEEKLTITVVSDISLTGEITNQMVVESIICSNARLVYEEVDDLFDGKESSIPESIVNDILEMRKLSKILSERRISEGYIRFRLSETEFIFDDDGNINDLVRSKETDSHRMIENFMLVANEYIATYLKEAPTVYRIHEKPDVEKLEELKQIVKNYGIDFKITANLNETIQKALTKIKTADQHRVFDRFYLRSMKRAKYSVINYGHFGLGMKNYTHFTSPIRRICDLLVHHQVKKSLRENSKKVFSKELLFNYAKTATEREMIADESEREVEIKNKMNFMRQFIGDVMEGIIITLNKNAMIIELDRYPITGKIPLSSLEDDHYEFNDNIYRVIGRRKGKLYQLADKVSVIIDKVEEDVFFRIQN